MADKYPEQKYVTEQKEIYRDSLRKYVNIASDKLKEYGKEEKEYNNIRGFLETKSVTLNYQDHWHEQQIVSATVLLVIDDLTITIKLF